MPKFGYETKGGSAIDVGVNVHGVKFTCTYAGIAKSITLYCKQYSTSTPKMKFAIYADNAGVPAALVGYTEEWTLTSGWDNWKTLNIISGGDLTADTVYWLVFWPSATYLTVYYNAGDENQFAYKATAYNGFPNPFPANPTYAGLKFSVYCTYGAAYTQTVSEILGMVDSVPTKATFHLTVSDSLGMVDSALRKGAFKQAVSDSLGMSDAVGTKAAFKQAISDVLGIVDSASRARGFLITISEILGMRDRVEGRKHAGKIGDLPDDTITGGA